jgi:hypothetical protein
MLYTSYRSTVAWTTPVRWRAPRPSIASLLTISSSPLPHNHNNNHNIINNRQPVVVIVPPFQSCWRLNRALFSSSTNNNATPASNDIPNKNNNTTKVDSNHQGHDSANTDSNNIVLLYERSPERNGLPQAAFAASTINSTYWIWYAFDFVPAINNSPVAELHIDPSFGLFGLGISMMLQSVFTLYPLHLVSKLEYDPSTQHVRLYRHSLPMVRPSKAPIPIIPLGGIGMDKASSDTTKILIDLKGNVQKYEGHLGVSVGGNNIFPFLIEIRQPYEIPNSQLFLEVLLDPQRLKHQSYKSSRSAEQPQTTSSQRSSKNSRMNQNNHKPRRR